jgi:hypothetical protein
MSYPRPEPTTVRLGPSRREPLLLAAGGLLFTLVGVAMIREQYWFAWPITAIFALATSILLLAVLPGVNGLVLHPEGFTCRNLGRRWTVRWDQVESFHVAQIGGRNLVGWCWRPESVPDSTLGQWSRALAGLDGTLPQTYGLTAEALLRRLQEWQRRHTSPATEPPRD